MSKGWSETDKKIVKVALDRARKRAEDQVLREFQETNVRRVEDLWELELKIREWRRDIKGRFYFSYDRIEELLHDFLKLGWTELSDLGSLSVERLENIKRGPGG